MRKDIRHGISRPRVFEQRKNAYVCPDGLQLKMRCTAGGERIGQVSLGYVPPRAGVTEAHVSVRRVFRHPWLHGEMICRIHLSKPNSRHREREGPSVWQG